MLNMHHSLLLTYDTTYLHKQYEQEQDNWSDQNGRPVTVTVAGGRALCGGNRHLTTDLETPEF